jgi:DNA-binding HxlR family transcriptional regulator
VEIGCRLQCAGQRLLAVFPVTRTVFPTIPPRVDYELTDLGRGLSKPVQALGMWAREHQPEIESARARFDGRNEGR